MAIEKIDNEVNDLERQLKLSTTVEFSFNEIIYETPVMDVEIPTMKKTVKIIYANRGNNTGKSRKTGLF